MRTYDLARAVARFDESSTYQGRPCRHGHAGRRYTANGVCIECDKARAKGLKQKPAKRDDEL